MKFSASQVTTMVVALCAVAVVAPVGAVAASSAVTLVDGDRPGWAASVDSSGRLAVSDGGAGRSITVDTAGTTVKVDGEVATPPPTNTWRVSATEQPQQLQNVSFRLTDPTNKPTRLSSLSVFLRDGEQPFRVNVFQREVPGTFVGDCYLGNPPGVERIVWSGFVRSDVPIQMSFPNPLRMAPAAGKNICAYVRIETSNVETFPLFVAAASGYYE